MSEALHMTVRHAQRIFNKTFYVFKRAFLIYNCCFQCWYECKGQSFYEDYLIRVVYIAVEGIK